MNVKQVEERLTELVHHQPFIPFVVELTDGHSIVVPHARVAFDGNSAVFIGPEGGFVDFELKNVRAIRPVTFEAVA